MVLCVYWLWFQKRLIFEIQNEICDEKEKKYLNCHNLKMFIEKFLYTCK